MSLISSDSSKRSKNLTSLPDVIIAGTGIKGVMHMTLETKEMLKSCDKIYVLHYDSQIVNYFRNYDATIVDASLYYEEGKKRSNVYKDLAIDILNDSQKSRVGFVVHGHPLFIVSTSEFLLEMAPKYDVKVEVLPSISSLDSLMVDIGEDFGFALQSYEVNYMLKMNPYLNNHIPLFIFQVAVLGSFDVNKEYTPSNFKVLTDYLLQYYPPEHKIQFILSTRNALFESDLVELSIDELNTATIDFLEARPTLYVPPVKVN